MTGRRLLIVEDNPQESREAVNRAVVLGIENVTTASNLKGALSQIEDADMIASDLFFPAGNVDTKVYSNRFMPLYEQYERVRFPSQEGGVVLRALEQVSGVFGVTPREYVEKVMPVFNAEGSTLLEAARDAVYGIKDYSKHQKFLEVKEGIASGKNLPLGIIVAEEAKKRKIPAVVVTSADHHDMAFSPIGGLIGVPYYDTLVDGRKNWKAGIERLKGLEEER